MITVPSFDSTQAKTLQSFLDATERHPDSMSYAAAAGFLFAVASAPELVQPSQWLPIIIDPDNATEISLEEMKGVTGSLMSLFNESTRQVQQADTKLPQGVSFNDEALKNLDPNASISQWADGFRQGYFWLEKVWSGYIPEEIKEEFGYQLTVLFFFSNQQMAYSLFDEVKNKEVTLESMAENMKNLFPEAMRGVALLGNSIHEALATRTEPNPQGQPPIVRNEKVGRNATCPCGSGRKFKKCCGFVQH